MFDARRFFAARIEMKRTVAHPATATKAITNIDDPATIAYVCHSGVAAAAALPVGGTGLVPVVADTVALKDDETEFRELLGAIEDDGRNDGA